MGLNNDAPVALVTGAGSGIGQATARMLHSRGNAVLAADISAGSIVVVGSTSGVAGDPRHFAYNAAKAAAINLARAAAIDWAIRGVRVNVVAPGATMTPILKSRGLDQDRLRSLVSNVPLQRFATAEEQAEAICFLASDAASFITGAVLMSDGGLTANAGVFPPPQKVET